MLDVEDLLEYAEKLKEDNDTIKVSLFFVTRHLKKGVTANAKVMDKHDFHITKAPIDPSISGFFKEVLSNQIISHASKDDIEMKQYTVIDDDIDNKIYAYALNNAMSFSHVINNSIKSDQIPELNDLSDIQNHLWAYCIKIQDGEEFTYSFRKIGKSKVTTNEPQTRLQKISAMFDKTGGELKEFDGNVISFDDKIDCIYINNEFYVFYKKSFESMVGLEEEFTEIAQKTLTIIKDLNIVEGLNILEEAILYKPSLRKTLAKIAEKGNHATLDSNIIQNMNSVLSKFEDRKFTHDSNGKIIISTMAEGRDFLRLLNDYYKQGMTTQKYYASDSGNLINTVK